MIDNVCKIYHLFLFKLFAGSVLRFKKVQSNLLGEQTQIVLCGDL